MPVNFTLFPSVVSSLPTFGSSILHVGLTAPGLFIAAALA